MAHEFGAREISAGSRVIYDLISSEQGKLFLYEEIWKKIGLEGAYQPHGKGGKQAEKNWFDVQVFRLNEQLAVFGEPKVTAVSKIGLVMGELNLDFLPQMSNNLTTGNDYGGRILVGNRGLVRVGAVGRQVIEELRRNENKLVLDGELTPQQVKAAKKLAGKIGNPGEEPGWQIRRKTELGYAWINLAIPDGKPAWADGFEDFDRQRNYWVVSAAGKVAELTGNEAFLLGLLVKQRRKMIDRKELLGQMITAGLINSNDLKQSLALIWWELREKLEGEGLEEKTRLLSTGRSGRRGGEYGLF
ncbi:MAG: hypothetical protein U0946_04420 [Patescibacteria group bacterium]|nr:hypothetical protein [Patescibacteria group bacterium]